jgi:FtsP/CotA-like multicopper oxidase with cupredoxin domain
VPLTIVAVDGVVAGAAGQAAPGSSPAFRPLQLIQRTSLLLMPAARVELLVQNWSKHAAPQTLILRTAGVQTGVTADAGDVWPPINLAEVTLDSAPSAHSPNTRIMSALQDEQPPAIQTLAMLAPNAAPPHSLRRLDQAQMPVCTHAMARNERRRVTFTSHIPADIEALELGLAIVDNTEHVVAELPARTMPHSMDFSKDDHFCAVLGAEEVWELYNDTDELHNFHIHQAKFRLATVAEIAAVTTQPADVQPSSLPMAPVGEHTQEEDSFRVWHDTYPVAPHRSVFIQLSFIAPEQRGRFVFHCHILEHEDKGMMAPFEVLDP